MRKQQMERMMGYIVVCGAMLFIIVSVSAIQLENGNCFCSFNDKYSKCHPNSNRTDDGIYYLFGTQGEFGNISEEDRGVFNYCSSFLLPTDLTVVRVDVAADESASAVFNRRAPFPITLRPYEYPYGNIISESGFFKWIAFIISDNQTKLTNDNRRGMMDLLEPFTLENVITAVLNNLPNPQNLTHFRASGFSANLTNETFDNVTNLECLELVNLNLSHLPLSMLKNLLNLKCLGLSRNKLKTLPEIFFQNQQKLRSVVLSNNNIWYLGDCDTDTITHYSTLVDRCNRSSNFLRHLQNLQWLDLSFNQISNISSTFLGKNIVFLILNHNNLTSLENICSLGENNIIAKLDLDYNNLVTLSPIDVWCLKNMTELVLSRNSLSDIHELTFQNLKWLYEIYLDDNFLHLSSYSKKMIFGDYTYMIRMKNNHLHKIPPIQFSNMIRISTLDFRNNDITYVNVNDFELLVTERYLNIYLQNNRIVTLEFTNYLNGVVSQGLSADELVIFLLNDNPIRCDCNLKWLSEYDNNTNPFKFAIDEVRCNEPPPFKDALFESIPKSLLHCVNSHECPINCSCISKNEKSIVVDCSNAGLRAIPSVIPNGTTSLNLDFNSLINLKFLSPTCKWDSLLHLSLKSSVNERIVVRLESNPFTQLTKLDQLILQKNNLTQLPNTFFKGLVRLSELDLSFNRLAQLPDDIFDQLSNLKSLNLGHNRLTNLPNGLFLQNNMLRVFRCPFNQISRLQQSWSNNLRNLRSIDLSDNKINVVNGTIWPNKLKELLFNSNNITIFDFQTIPSSLELLELRFNHITSINTKEFAHFDSSVLVNLENNQIRYVHLNQSDVFVTKKRNHFAIELDFNPIVCDEQNLPFLKYIQNETIDQIRFGVGDLHCWEPLFMKGKLLELETDLPKRELICPDDCECFTSNENNYRILQCSDIQEISSSTFQTEIEMKLLIARNGRMTSLNNLQLNQYQYLETLNIKNFNASKHYVLHPAFDQMKKHLKYLTLVACQIGGMDEDVFSNLTELIELDLSSNEIKQLDTNTFTFNNKLKILNLSFNLISHISRELFLKNTKVESLDLSQNQLQNLNGEIFANLIQLKALKLNNNNLINIGKKLMANCKNLRNLDLSQNNLTSDEVGDLEIPRKIETLDFSRNKLTKFNANWIKLPMLSSADFSSNQIQMHHQILEHFSSAKKLTIHLSDNNITEFHWKSQKVEKWVSGNGQIELTLSNNPFNCDCQLKEFVETIQRSRENETDVVVVDRNSVQCSSPESLKDKHVKDLQIDDLRCPLEGCPQFCFCFHYSSRELMVVECHDQRLTQIPNNCPANINVLVLNSTWIKSLNGIENECWKNLKRLTITNNELDQLLKSNLLIHTKLIELRLPRNQLITIPNEFLKNTIELEILDLSYNKLMSFSGELIGHLKKLNHLDISHNQIKSVASSLVIESLEVLNISGNHIRSLFIPSQLKNQKLELFNISNNSLENFQNESNNFKNLKYLRVLDVARNNLSFTCNSAKQCRNFLPLSLHFLNISHNSLHCINFCNWTLYGRLELIDLSFNNISNLNLKDLAFANNTNVTVRCIGCNIRKYSQHLAEITPIKNRLTLDIANNEIECLCQLTQFHHRQPLLKNFDFTVAFRVIDNFACYYNDKLKVLPNVTVDAQACIVKEQCPNECLCLKPEFESVSRIAMYCNNNHLTEIPSFCPQNTQLLNLDENNITELRGLKESQWKNLTHVSIRNNNLNVISDLNWPPFVKMMHLDGNQFQTPSGWLKTLVDELQFPFNVTLANNPWTCDCSNVKFQKWLLADESKTVMDLWEIVCANETSFVKMNLCHDAPSKVIVISISVLFVISISVLAFFTFYLKNKSKVLMWLYSKRLCMFCINTDDIDVDKEYDAFVSYANEDEDFVQTVLLPTLEDEENNFKICDHARDWLLGEQIIDQIWTSIEKSRRVIIVMSENFVKSVWAAIEFQLAISKSMDDKLNRIVVIMLDENLSLDELDPQLRLYVRMNTFLKRSDPRFWTKLLYKMPRGKANKKRPPTNELSDRIELLPVPQIEHS